jgi:CRP-like cAMP-binding protein
MSQNKMYRKIVRAYHPGEILFQEGDAWDGMYCIQKGSVGVYKKQALPAGGEVELARLGPGSLLGELGIFEPAARDAGVKALEATEALVVTRQMFEEQLKSLPPWVAGVVKVLVSRLRAANAKHLDLLRQLEHPDPDGGENASA